VAISTIASNSTSVALPDLDVSVFSNLNAGLNTSPQMLSILLSSTAAVSLSASIAQVDLIDDNIKNNAVTKNPPLPTWATYTNRSNEPAFVTYGSNMQPMFGGYLRDDTEGQDWPDRGARYTNTSQGTRGTGHSSVKGTNFQQDEGNWLVRLPGHAPASGSDGQFSHSVWYNMVNEYWPFFGTMIQKSGVRPRNSIYYRNNNLGIYPRSGVSPLEHVPMSSTYAAWTNTNTGYTAISYNVRTNTLAVLEPRDNSNNYRLHVWKNANPNRDLDSENYTAGTMHRFLLEARTAGTPTSLTQTAYYYYNDFQWQANSSQSYDESRRKAYIVMGDNNLVGIARFVPSNITHYATFQPNFATTSGTLTTLNGIGNTTSYGIEQGTYYGMRYMQTWDNNWFAAYSPYYYYQSGFNCIWFNSQDPSKYYVSQWGSTDWGAQIVPFKKDKFLFHSGSSNVDGNVGMRLYVVDLGGLLKYGRDSDGTAQANGSNISLFKSTFTYSFDTRYQSTNYPTIVPMAEWTHG
jgi:hypothetical protein